MEGRRFKVHSLIFSSFNIHKEIHLEFGYSLDIHIEIDSFMEKGEGTKDKYLVNQMSINFPPNQPTFWQFWTQTMFTSHLCYSITIYNFIYDHDLSHRENRGNTDLAGYVFYPFFIQQKVKFFFSSTLTTLH